MLNFFTGRFDAGGLAAPAALSLDLLAAFACGPEPITAYAAKVPAVSQPRELLNLLLKLLLLPSRFILRSPFHSPLRKKAWKVISARAIFQTLRERSDHYFEKWRRLKQDSVEDGQRQTYNHNQSTVERL